MLEQRTSLKIRGVTLADAAALAALFAETWHQAYQGVLPIAHLQSMIRTRDERWWRRAAAATDTAILVLEVGGKVSGYATCGRARTRGRYQGEIFELYISPTHQGLGFGEHLFEACRHLLEMRRLNGLIVWALAVNTQAATFYWNRGGRPVAERNERIGGKSMAKVAFVWT
jgi:GNAT superfamily N-acetyltransferase